MKAGRPLKSDAPLGHVVKFRVTDRQLQWLRLQAAKRDVPVADLLRLALAAYSRRQLRPSDPDIALFDAE